MRNEIRKKIAMEFAFLFLGCVLLIAVFFGLEAVIASGGVLAIALVVVWFVALAWLGGKSFWRIQELARKLKTID